PLRPRFLSSSSVISAGGTPAARPAGSIAVAFVPTAGARRAIVAANGAVGFGGQFGVRVQVTRAKPTTRSGPTVIGDEMGLYRGAATEFTAWHGTGTGATGAGTPTVRSVATFAANLPTTAPVAHGGVAGPLRVISPFAGLTTTVIATGAPFAFPTHAPDSTNGVNAGVAGLTCGTPRCSAGRVSAIAVARTVNPSRRTEQFDAGSSPWIVVALPKVSGSDGPLDPTSGSVCPSRSRYSFERRRRTRNAFGLAPPGLKSLRA